uniref:INB domain-containing protein n=1 Tax=Anopheles melas TaxID=34690 RepID=A0A182TRN4_9DIPT
MDVIVFLLTSLGYILQAFYYQIFGVPKKDLNGEIALVTGGGGGLGRLLALRLIKLGAKVVLWDINQEGLDDSVKLIQSLGGLCKGYKVDISNKEEVYKYAKIIQEEIGDVMGSRTISFKYKPAKNYPLDMYYLMDLTWSMRDDKATLENMGKNDQCEPTYGFRHRLKITRDIDSFIAQVKESNVTGNVDNLEAGLDALMQVLVCEKQIGWGSNTRKIVIVATDGWLHMAGDGLLAGIVEENDKQCHLDSDGNFVDALKYDYPSLEQIWRVLLRSKTAVIFAVTEAQQEYYRRLSDLMPEFTSVGRLQDDSSNIIQLNITVRIEEKLISNEAVELDIDLRTSCNCEKNKKPMELSELCNFNGDYTSGRQSPAREPNAARRNFKSGP